jgi:hypothetical protein
MMFLYIIFNFNNIIPVILTLVGNLIFYLFIKNKVDKSIEENKIAYSGVFREKIDIYRELVEYNLDVEVYDPYADNEATYNANSSWWDDASRMVGQFGNLAGTGFLSAYRSIGDLFDDDS